MVPATTEILERLKKLHPKVIDLSLGRINRLLRDLGNPHHRLAPVIHVAGTNGKGSTVAYLRAIFEAAGYRVHAYISPHLVHFNERIRLAGQLIEDGLLAQLLMECERINDGKPITFFEITTAAAFLAFAQTKADIVLLETGLGGRLDATNVIDHPLLSIITPISFDHMAYLGSTLAKIASEKAGIMKKGVPAVISAQPDEAMQVFMATANKLQIPVSRCGVEWQVYERTADFVFQDDHGQQIFAKPILPGAHQILNAAAVVAACQYLTPFDIKKTHIAQGFQSADWPARLQKLKRGVLIEKLPQGWELWLDGAHNQGGGQVLANWLDQQALRPTYLIMGMISTKKPHDFLACFINKVSGVQVIPIDSADHTAFTPFDIIKSAQNLDLNIASAACAATALDEIIKCEKRPSRVVICGSLYLAGEILKNNE